MASPSSEADQQHVLDVCSGAAALRASEKYTDVSFAVGGRTFRAHRVFLCSASSYFSRMFDSSFAEASVSEPIAITDISAAAFEVLLAFIYTGVLKSISPENACEIWRAADMVCFARMDLACVEYLCEHITCGNCCAVIRTASELGKFEGNFEEAPSAHALFKAAVAFAGARVRDVLREEGRDAFLGLNKHGMFALVQEAFPIVAEEPDLLLELWSIVREWGKAHFGAAHIGSFYESMRSLQYDDIDFVQATDFSMRLTLASDRLLRARHHHLWSSDIFDVGCFGFSLSVQRVTTGVTPASPRARRKIDGIYVLCLNARRRPAVANVVGCFAHWVWLCSGIGLPNDFARWPQDAASFFFSGRDVGNSTRSVPISEVESRPGAHIVFRVRVKRNSLLELCTSAAMLDFASCAPYVLSAFARITDPREEVVLSEILQSDALAVRLETDLLRILATFGDSVPLASCAGSQPIISQMLDYCLQFVRLGEVPFSSLHDIVSQSRSLQQSKRFAELLTEFFRFERASASSQPAARMDDSEGLRSRRMDDSEGLRSRRRGTRAPFAKPGSSAVEASAAADAEEEPAGVEGLVRWLQRGTGDGVQVRSVLEKRRFKVPPDILKSEALCVQSEADLLRALAAFGDGETGQEDGPAHRPPSGEVTGLGNGRSSLSAEEKRPAEDCNDHATASDVSGEWSRPGSGSGNDGGYCVDEVTGPAMRAAATAGAPVSGEGTWHAEGEGDAKRLRDADEGELSGSDGDNNIKLRQLDELLPCVRLDQIPFPVLREIIAHSSALRRSERFAMLLSQFLGGQGEARGAASERQRSPKRPPTAGGSDSTAEEGHSLLNASEAPVGIEGIVAWLRSEGSPRKRQRTDGRQL
eukprot:NODE_485_length_2998_cov_3.561477.p1 GENE.NODE_485_length_2998_cov_3.561477~~NODE_485_length_2998_cov_3.561477.p1  ORF type:complete len:871 (-),score=172.21 NODE_485_length_2998_cov_3.561477:187-2799(-)